jgi:hypothetical protein
VSLGQYQRVGKNKQLVAIAVVMRAVLQGISQLAAPSIQLGDWARVIIGDDPTPSKTLLDVARDALVIFRLNGMSNRALSRPGVREHDRKTGTVSPPLDDPIRVLKAQGQAGDPHSISDLLLDSTELQPMLGARLLMQPGRVLRRLSCAVPLLEHQRCDAH